MAKKRHEPSDSEILKARNIAQRLNYNSVSAMGRADQEALVRSYYMDIHGAPISRLSKDQLFRIAERLYGQTHNWARRETSSEIAEKVENKAIYDEIGRLAEMVRAGAGEEATYDLEEQICIQMEHLPDSAPVVCAYNAARNKKQQ